MTRRRSSGGSEPAVAAEQDDQDRAAVADEVAIDVESAGADLHNAVDALTAIVAEAATSVRSARETGWSAERVEAALDTASARARLRAVDRALAVLASVGPRE